MTNPVKANTNTPNIIGKQAVVIGAGIAGISAARVLTDFYDRVIVLERDDLPSQDRPRAGAPQGRHPHLLLGGGYAALSELFPEIGRDFEFAGAIPLAAGRDLGCEIPGLGFLPKRDFGIQSFAMTRPVLELVLRRRVKAMRNIEWRENSRAIEIMTAIHGARVIGVKYEQGDGREVVVGADLVVDASGHAILSMGCLQASGYQLPHVDAIGVDLGYATGLFELPSAVAPDFTAMVTLPTAPESSRSGYMLRVGDALWQVLLVGRGQDRPPSDLSAFHDFAATLPSSTIANALRHADPRSEIARFRFRESICRHFGELSHLPKGLVPIGDTFCRFNPVYGQGMSVAALEAVLLRRVLIEHAASVSPLAYLATDFASQAEALIEGPWGMSAIPDFVYPETTGARPKNLADELQRQATAYRDAMDNADIHRDLYERMHLMNTVVPQRASIDRGHVDWLA